MAEIPEGGVLAAPTTVAAAPEDVAPPLFGPLSGFEALHEGTASTVAGADQGADFWDVAQHAFT